MSGIQLDHIPLNGRSLAEYLAIFDLDEVFQEETPLADRHILDIAAGPSSFAAEAAGLGATVTALDPAYVMPTPELSRLSTAQIAAIRQNIEPVRHAYRWDFYHDPDDLRSRREEVLSRFLNDYQKAPMGRYVAGSLPYLPFKDGSFQLALCSHFLFLFADRLDYRFHLKSMLEMTRVSPGAALVYPVVNLEGKPYGAMDRLTCELAEKGVTARLIKTEFEFLKGATQLMRLQRGA